MNQQPDLLSTGPAGTTSCVRCARPCRLGTPDPTKRMIVAATEAGFCADCMITWTIKSLEQLVNIIDGTPQRGGAPGTPLIPARPGRGPEILLDKHIREAWRPVLAYTQLPWESINWLTVYLHWDMPWPKGFAPKPGTL